MGARTPTARAGESGFMEAVLTPLAALGVEVKDIVAELGVEVQDIVAARDRLTAEGARVLGDGEPKIGAHDKPVLFLHPKDFCGTLIELEQA